MYEGLNWKIKFHKQVKATKEVCPKFFTEYLLLTDESAVSLTTLPSLQQLRVVMMILNVYMFLH